MADHVIGSADYELGVDTTKLKQGIAAAETTIKGSGAEIEKAFDGKATESVNRFGTKLAGLKAQFDKLGGPGSSASLVGNLGARGFEVMASKAYDAGQAIGDFIHDSIQKASDLNETLGKSAVVFGDQSAAVEKWGSTTADAFGLSKQKAIEYAASFGNVFKGLDIAADKSAQMSEKLVGLAGDLASFNNIDVGDALEKLRAGLAGEVEPLRSVGVFMSDAQLQAKALQLGLGGAHRELTDGEKILARYQLILEQTTTAQGDFARTSDGLANSQRKANAELDDMQAQLGQQMLPAQLAVTNAQLNFFKGLNLLGDELSGKVTPAVLQHIQATYGTAVASDVARGAIAKMDDETRDAAVAMGLLTQADIDAAAGISTAARAQSDAAVVFGKSAQGMQDDARESGRILRQSSSVSVTAIDGIGDQAKDTAKDVKDAFADMQAASGRWRHDLLADARKVVDDYYTVVIDQDQLAATNAEISAQRRIIASSTSSAAEKRDARSKLHELERTQAQLETDLASHGATTSAAFKTTMADLLKRLKTAHGTERTAILAEIRALDLLTLRAKIANGVVLTLGESIEATLAKGGYVNAAGAGAGGHPSGTGYAFGGHYPAGVPRIVGEHGPQWDSPDHSGTIIPDVMAGAARASSTSIRQGDTIVTFAPGAINLSGIGNNVSPVDARRFGQSVMDVVAEGLKQQSRRIGGNASRW